MFVLDELLKNLENNDYYVMGKTILKNLILKESESHESKKIFDNFDSKFILVSRSFQNKEFILKLKDLIELDYDSLSLVEKEFVKEIKLSELILKRRGEFLMDDRLALTWNAFQKSLGFLLWFKISKALKDECDLYEFISNYSDKFVYLIHIDWEKLEFNIIIYYKDSTIDYSVINELKINNVDNCNTIYDFLNKYVSKRFNSVKNHMEKNLISMTFYYDDKHRFLYDILDYIDLNYLDIKFDEYKFIRLKTLGFNNISIHCKE